VRLAAIAVVVALFGQAGPAQQPASRWFRLGGMIVDSQGRPPLPGTVIVNLSGASGSESTEIDQSGQFEFVVPAPEAYRLSVAIYSLGDHALLEYASRELTLAKGARVPFVIVTKPAIRLQGHVTFEGDQPGPSDALTIRADDASGRGGGFWIDPADVDAEGAFLFPAYGWARLLRPGGAGMRNRALKAVLRNGVDVTDIPTDFAPGDRVELVVTSRLSTLRGNVTTAGGAIADMAQVFLFAEDPAVWVPHSSRVYVTRAGMDGRYGLRGIRPGRYLIAAIPFQENVFAYDTPRDLLGRLAPIATPVTITEGDARVADLTQRETTETAEGRTDQTLQRRNAGTK
jgi:hypothetical protein